MGEPRILQFCHCHYGPFADVARQYAVLFRDTPYKVTTVFLTDPPNDEVAAKAASDEVVFLNYDGKDVRGLKLDAMRRLRQIVAGRDFRLVIAHRFKPVFISCWATDLPVIGVHHAFGDYDRLSRRLFAHLFRKRLSLLGVSKAVRDDIRAQLPSWPQERIATLYNRIDVAAVRAELLSRTAARDLLGLPQDAFVVGNVGRLHPDKDQETLLRGFALAVPDLPAAALLAIVGTGRLENRLRALADELGIAGRVRFLGHVAHARRAFPAFDVFALSSDREPFGMVLLEAMAAGVAVVVTDCGGAPEVLGDSGLLFPLGDAPALSRHLIALAGSEEERSALASKAGSRLAATFTDEAAVREFFALPIVRDVLRQTPRRAA